MNVVECDVPSGSILSRELIERAPHLQPHSADFECRAASPLLRRVPDAGNRHGFDRDVQITTVEAPQYSDQPWLRLDRNDPTAEAAKGSYSIADMAPDVEDEVTLSHKVGIEPVHAPPAHRVAVVDHQ